MLDLCKKFQNKNDIWKEFMKKFMYVFLMFQSIIMFSQDDILIKIEQKDGSFLTYNLSDIEEINFNDFSLSSVCNICFINDSLFSIQTYKIVSMALKHGNSNIDSLSIYFYYYDHYNYLLQKNLNIPINVIDSITFLNTNEIYGKVFSNINIEFIGLNAVYQKYTTYNPPGDTKSYDETKSFDRIIDLMNNFHKYWNPYYWGCGKCFNQKIIGDLDYCYAVESYTGTHNTCNYSYCYLFLDTEKMIIDSLFYINIMKDEYPPKAGGSYRDELNYEESLKIYSVPYILQNDNKIVVNYKIDDLSKIKYSMSSHHYVGTSGNNVDSYSYFTKFLPPTDSATIAIVIKE